MLAKKRRKWLGLLAVGMLILFVPYLVSRALAPQRQISVREISGVHAAVPTSEKDEAAKTIRVAAYNIAHGRGLSDETNWTEKSDLTNRLDQIASVLRDLDADVVILNEVDFDSSWSHHIDQAQYLAERACFRFVAQQRNLDFRVLGWTWRFGNAILSKFPIDRARLIKLPAFAQWESMLAGQKDAMACDVVVNGQSVRVVAAHLSPRNEAIRVSSCRAIMADAEQTDLPVIVLGDFNSTPSGFPNHKTDDRGLNAIQQLSLAEQDSAARWQRLPATLPNPEGYTFPSDTPAQVIDWIFVPASFDVKEYGVMPVELSDHRPVYAEIQVAP